MIKIHVKNHRNKQICGNFIMLSCCFRSNITAVVEGKEGNAKSIMKAPTIETAEEIDFVIDGEDEVEASDAVRAYFENDKTNN